MENVTSTDRYPLAIAKPTNISKFSAQVDDDGAARAVRLCVGNEDR
jgi:hypothetical protein